MIGWLAFLNFFLKGHLVAWYKTKKINRLKLKKIINSHANKLICQRCENLRCRFYSCANIRRKERDKIKSGAKDYPRKDTMWRIANNRNKRTREKINKKIRRKFAKWNLRQLGWGGDERVKNRFWKMKKIQIGRKQQTPILQTNEFNNINVKKKL